MSMVSAPPPCTAEEALNHFSDLPILHLRPPETPDVDIVAILGGGHMDGSFKNLLGLGIIRLLHETGALQPGQAIIESSSGSMGEGLACAGRLLGHPIIIVSDPNLPEWTATRIRQFGARLILVDKPDPVGGWQQARENKVRQLMADTPDLVWPDQNNNPLNPEVYSRWLIPKLASAITPGNITASVFVVGSGGHFSALTRWLKRENTAIRAHAVDRVGSITFGAPPAPSLLRGIGNQNIVPNVMAANKDLVDAVEYVDDGTAFRACHSLGQAGCFVGGSSGAAYAAACRVAARLGQGTILTLFPDRGDIYRDSIWNEAWMQRNGFF